MRIKSKLTRDSFEELDLHQCRIFDLKCAICIGQAASVGSLLLAAVAKGERLSLSNARVIVHQPLGGYSGQAKDMTIHSKEVVRISGYVMHDMHCL